MGDARVDQVKGDVKEAAGKATGNEEQEAEGRVESAVAGVRREAGEVADKAKDVAGDVADKTTDVSSGAVDKAKDVVDR